MIRLYYDGKEWVYLGYLLSLGRAEHAILSVLVSAKSGLDTTALAEKSGIASANISAAVRRINQKAEGIGGRKLILSGRAEGYRLSDDM